MHNDNINADVKKVCLPCLLLYFVLMLIYKLAYCTKLTAADRYRKFEAELHCWVWPFYKNF